MRYDLFEGERAKAEVLPCGIKVLKGTSVTGKVTAMIWMPKAQNPFANYSFRNEEDRAAYIEKQVANYKYRLEEKAKRKAERLGTADDLAKVKVGDIYHFSWGYDQTNCDFYQVVSVKGHYAEIREIGQKRAESETTGNGMSEYRLPIKDAFLEKEEAMKKKIQFSNGKPYFKMASYGWCDQWSGTPEYCSWYA